MLPIDESYIFAPVTDTFTKDILFETLQKVPISITLIISMMFDYIFYDITIIKIWLFTLSIALIDTGITLIQRLIIHHNILQEHKDHAFQILANRYNHNYSILWLIFNYIFIIFPILTLNFLQIISFLLSAILIIFLLMIQILYIKIKLK